MKKPLRLISLLLMSFFTLSGCESEMSLRKICEIHPELCRDLNTDSHCKKDRADLIRLRYQEKTAPSHEIRYQYLLKLEEYSKCVERASHIEHIKLKEKKTSRVNGYVTSLREIERISRLTARSNDPDLLYWHWSRNGDEKALNRFLELRDTGALETPEMQFRLATYWVKIDRNRTINILYHALELYKAGDDVNPEIFKSLSSIYLKEQKFKHAYVWGYIAKDYGMTDIDLAPLKAVLSNQNIKISKLNRLADGYIDMIEDGDFIPPSR